MKICKYCALEHSNDQKKCSICGSTEFHYKCDYCGHIVTEGNFCPVCGTRKGRNPTIGPTSHSIDHYNLCPFLQTIFSSYFHSISTGSFSSCSFPDCLVNNYPSAIHSKCCFNSLSDPGIHTNIHTENSHSAASFYSDWIQKDPAPSCAPRSCKQHRPSVFCQHPDLFVLITGFIFLICVFLYFLTAV